MRATQNVDFEARAARMCAQAIGKELKVRLRPEDSISRRDTITGQIVEACFDYWKTERTSRVAVFKCVIVAGVSQTRRIVRVTRLPQ
jgi:hypothetical protein